MRIYTKKGDDGTTGLLYGGRVAKDSGVMAANGAVDEAQALLGLVRAEAGEECELHTHLVRLERELWVLMAEVATAPGRRGRLAAGTSLVTAEMVGELESLIDEIGSRFAMPSEFVVPGQNRVSALLDVARTVVRRAERLTVALVTTGGLPRSSEVVPYLNRLSDLLWVMARAQEDDHLLARDVLPQERT